VACPVHAIVVAPPTFFAASGTPMVDAHMQACVMCEDTPCITACGPRVLRKDRSLKMGTAIIQQFNCLAHTGTFCTVCSERCPVPGAIELDGGKPRIVDEKCTGCGVCHEVCPAPATAVIVIPLHDRPA
jgi:ferredoxin-type protein NapG